LQSKTLWVNSIHQKPRILLVEDDDAAQFGYVRYFRNNGYETISARSIKAAKDTLSFERFDVILLDLKLPDGDSLDWIPELKKEHSEIIIFIITGMNDVPTAVKAIKDGADNFLTKPVDMSQLQILINTYHEARKKARHRKTQKQLVTHAPFFGCNTSTVENLKLAEIAATSTNVVLILGETGTGKGILARWIHDHSSRASGPFVEVNCSTLKGEFLRSELFGHARGAFTSAIKDKEGLLEVAHNGTLFLDEIGDMDADAQVQLLKTIEEHTFRRLGENNTRHSNFRLICATNQDLQISGTNGFRQDLYYRICIFPINLKSLREKKDEIPSLCEHILKSIGYRHLPLSNNLLQLLQEYPWPGNIRELKNMLERAIMLAQGEPLSTALFIGIGNTASPPPSATNSQKLNHIEDLHILQVIADLQGNMQQASKLLGLSVSSLYRRLSRIRNGVSTPSDESGTIEN